MTATDAPIAVSNTPDTTVACLDWLTLDPAFQVREGLDEPTVARYAQQYAEVGDCGALPPVTAIATGERRPDGRPVWLLVDGWHRVAACQRAFADRAEIRVQVIQGDLTVARIFAAQANRAHGLPLSSREKRRAIDLYLADADLAKDTDRQIARRLCVSHTLVSEVRRARAEAASASTAPAETAQPTTLPPVPEHLTHVTDRRRFRILAVLGERTTPMAVADIEAAVGERGLKNTLRAMAVQDMVEEETYGSHRWLPADAGQRWYADQARGPASAQDGQPCPVGHQPPPAAERRQPVIRSEWPEIPAKELPALVAKELRRGGSRSGQDLADRLSEILIDQERRLPDGWRDLVQGRTIDGHLIVVDADDDTWTASELRPAAGGAVTAPAADDLRHRLLRDLPQSLPLTTAQQAALVCTLGITADEQPTTDQMLTDPELALRTLHDRLRTALAEDLQSVDVAWGMAGRPTLQRLSQLLGLG